MNYMVVRGDSREVGTALMDLEKEVLRLRSGGWEPMIGGFSTLCFETGDGNRRFIAMQAMVKYELQAFGQALKGE